jgi:sensor c-di-GMP phosphodiesterase-like protein
MDARIQIVTGAVTLLGLIVIVDLVRRRRLLERYALLWLFSAVVLLGFVLWLLLHFSVAISRLSDQTKVLAQRLAITEERLQRHERQAAEHASSSRAQSEAEEPQRLPL